MHMRELEEPQYFLEGAVTVAGGIVGLKPTGGVPEGAKAAQPTLVRNSGPFSICSPINAPWRLRSLVSVLATDCRLEVEVEHRGQRRGIPS